MVITFACSICTKTIGDNDDSIYCDKCNLWAEDLKQETGRNARGNIGNAQRNRGNTM